MQFNFPMYQTKLWVQAVYGSPEMKVAGLGVGVRSRVESWQRVSGMDMDRWEVLGGGV